MKLAYTFFWSVVGLCFGLACFLAGQGQPKIIDRTQTKVLPAECPMECEWLEYKLELYEQKYGDIDNHSDDKDLPIINQA